MSRLTINGTVAVRDQWTRDGRRYSCGHINVAGMTFKTDVNSEHDMAVLRRIAREAGVPFQDWRENVREYPQ